LPFLTPNRRDRCEATVPREIQQLDNVNVPDWHTPKYSTPYRTFHLQCDGCYAWSRSCPPFRSTWWYSRFLWRFTLLLLYFLWRSCSILFICFVLVISIVFLCVLYRFSDLWFSGFNYLFGLLLRYSFADVSWDVYSLTFTHKHE
jgi:hypothetical protein